MKYAVLLSLLLILVIAGCGDFASHNEVARVSSPDGKIDAVLVESNGGATTSFWYDVHLVEAGASYDSNESAAYLYGAVRNDNAYGANLLWLSASQLEIQFLSARTSTVNTATVRLVGATVSVSLHPGVLDGKAPPGGMHYNLGTAEHGS